MNSDAYCQPDFSSEIFNFYWKECQDNDGYIKDAELYTYSELMIAFYPYSIDPVACTDDFYKELTEIYSLFEQLGETVNPNSTQLIEFANNQTHSTSEDSYAVLLGCCLAWMFV
jgi:hypothetical protein